MTGRAILLAVLYCVAASPAPAACYPPAPVRFAHGASAADIAGGVPRGMPECFTITARAGQEMSVAPAQGSTRNIVVQVYAPPWQLERSPDGGEVTGKTLAGDDAPTWSGVLPSSGVYLLVVGTSWGGGEYHLHVAVRNR